MHNNCLPVLMVLSLETYPIVEEGTYYQIASNDYIYKVMNFH